MNLAFARILSAVAPLTFRNGARAEAWQLVADMLASRMDAGRALDLVASMYRRRGNFLTAHVLLDLRASIPRGEFAVTAARISSPAETLLFSRYGTADAERIFAGAARIARTQKKIADAIVNAVAQPAFLLILVAVLFYILGTRLFPTFAQLSPEASWPAQTVAIAHISAAVVQYHWLVAAGFVVAFFAIKATLDYDWPGRPVFDLLPPWSLYKIRVGAAFLFAVVETARMGLDLKSATLAEMARLTPAYPRARINRIAKEMQRANLGDAAIRAGDNFPSADLNTVLSAMASMDGWVDRFALYLDRWMENIEQSIKRITAVVNVVLLSVVTGVIGASLSAIFSILQTIH